MSENNLGPDEAHPARAKKRSPKTTKPPQPIRSARMQFEILEPRDMMAPLAELPVGVSSEYDNAAEMSAFFEQSALYYVAQPVAFPNVVWISHLEPSFVEPFHPQVDQQFARIEAMVEMEFDHREREPAQLPLAPGAGARAAGPLRRILRLKSEWPAHVFAPTIDMGASPVADLSDIAGKRNILFFDLAYITADDQNRPSWCGMAERTVGEGPFDEALRQQIHVVRLMGGDVMVSFGGPQGTPLAEAITDVRQLKGAYRGVVRTYGLSRINFDLDGAALDDEATIQRRWQAIAGLQREMADAGLPLDIWLTLPASKNGLSNAAVDVIRAARENGVLLDGVNFKTDAGESTSPQADAKAGHATIEAAINAFYQLPQVFVRDADGGGWTGVGVTPVIGQDAGNDTAFTPADARELYDFAQRHGIGMLGTQQTSRDAHRKLTEQRGGEAGSDSDESAAEVSKIFREFTASSDE